MKLFLCLMKPPILSVALSLVLLTGCATNKPESEQWLEDKGLVLQSLRDAHLANTKLYEDITNMDERILSLEQLTTDQTTKIVILESALAASKTKAKVAVRAPGSAGKNASVLNKRLDRMSAKLILPPVAVKTVSVKQAASNEKNAYTAAYLAFKSGRYNEASSGFVSVINTHPKGEYTDQAYYWLGESLVAQRRNKEALESFTMVIKNYPQSPKYAAALFKTATVYKSMQQIGDAKAALLRVIKEYPDSRTAERARVQLTALSESNGAEK
jgi:tol-pal system protein YbgF